MGGIGAWGTGDKDSLKATVHRGVVSFLENSVVPKPHQNWTEGSKLTNFTVCTKFLSAVLRAEGSEAIFFRESRGLPRPLQAGYVPGLRLSCLDLRAADPSDSGQSEMVQEVVRLVVEAPLANS